MSSSFVSVAIPAIKASFLYDAIQSVLNQTHHNLEVIVVNDKSVEDIKGVVNRFSDTRLRYYENEKNLGRENPAINWNRCLSLAQGEYFALLCDDDLYEPTFIEKMLNLAKKHPETNVFRARANFIDAEGRETEKYASAPEWESWDDYLWHVSHNYRTQTISEWMYRTEVIKQTDGYAMLPLAWYADYLSIFHFAKVGGIASTSEILVHFRQSGKNISSRDDENTIKKIQAAQMFRDAVYNMLETNQNRNKLIGGLEWLLRLHLKYNLEHAPKSILLHLLIKNRKYRIKRSMIWRALWHRD